MNDEQAKRPSVFRRLRAPAALNYLIMTSAGLLTYAMIMMGKGNDVGAMIAILLAIPGVLARWTAAPILVLLLTMYLFFDPGFMNLVGFASGTKWQFPRETGGFSEDDLILAAALLSYIVGQYRLTSLLYQGMPEDPTVRRDRDPADPPRRPAEIVPANELMWTLIVAGGCVIVGQIVWSALVSIEIKGRPNPAEFTVGASRFLLVAWLMGLSLMVVSAALVYMRSARMTRNEAALVLRDEYFQENRRETDRLHRWRKWFKERVALRRSAGK